MTRFFAWLFCQEVRALQARVRRRDEEIECLKRQRDAALETVERLQWAARLETARKMSMVKQLGAFDDAAGDVR